MEKITPSIMTWVTKLMEVESRAIVCVKIVSDTQVDDLFMVFIIAGFFFIQDTLDFQDAPQDHQRYHHHHDHCHPDYSWVCREMASGQKCRLFPTKSDQMYTCASKIWKSADVGCCYSLLLSSLFTARWTKLNFYSNDCGQPKCYEFLLLKTINNFCLKISLNPNNNIHFQTRQMLWQDR